MKKFYTFFISALFIAGLNNATAQDTLLLEDFQDDASVFVIGWDAFPAGGTNISNWTNFDEDNLPDANNRPQDWFLTQTFSSDSVLPSGGQNFVAASSSWLSVYTVFNRNWMMTPAITLSAANGMLSWKSAPRQTPRFLDGYSVFVSTTDNNETSFTDTVFQAASYVSANGDTVGNFSLYTFNPASGFVHGANGTFTEFDPSSDSTRLIGRLQPQSISLSQYAGQTIYIAFLHDSDDDNLIWIDDILVTGTGTVAGVAGPENVYKGLTIFPNPSGYKTALEFEMPKASLLTITVTDIRGKNVKEIAAGLLVQGRHIINLDVAGFAVGVYNVTLTSSFGTSTAKLIVE